MSSMNVIGFDTATDDTTVAAADRDELLFFSSIGPGEGGRPRHASRLLPEVERAAEAVGGWESVDRIAVGVGPGSFTGLRIGIATAKGLAQALGVELAAVGTLNALARGAPAGDRSVLALLDARRGEVFGALFDAGGSEVWEPFVAAPEQLLERIASLPEPPLALGSGALRFSDELERSGVDVAGGPEAHRIAAAAVCAIGASVAAAGPDGIAPVYLRAPDAERWRERDGKHN
jgi:tRNA threonylcarbamoyladenosine biosynthesis protein TsaB